MAKYTNKPLWHSQNNQDTPMIEVRIETEPNREHFVTCFQSSLPYVRQNLNWDAYGVEDIVGEQWMWHRYVQAFSDPNQVVFSVKKGERILGYFMGIIDHELDSLLLEYVLYNTDENGSRSWIYTDFYGGEGLKGILSELGLTRWHIKVFAENGDKTSQISAVPDGEATGPYGNRTGNYRLFKSPYGWD